MLPQQWQLFRAVAKGAEAERVPVALIVDSPWIPGYLGISHTDFFFDQEVWFRAHQRVAEDFPEVVFLPSWWIEYGMAIEPSACGALARFHADQPPSVEPVLAASSDFARLPEVNPAADGFMALALHRHAGVRKRAAAAGHVLPIVTARGPLCLAGFLRGITGLMTDLVEDPDSVHRLLEYCTAVVLAWLRAQAEAFGGVVEGVFLLDDIPGMLSRRAYQQFAHPYMQRVFGAFPADWVKIYHNDANIRPFLADLPELGIDVLNWSHNVPASEVIAKTGGRLTLLGNVAPLKTGVQGTPEQVAAEARAVVEQTGGKRLILSVGGGVSPGMPAANIHALARY